MRLGDFVQLSRSESDAARRKDGNLLAGIWKRAPPLGCCSIGYIDNLDIYF